MKPRYGLCGSCQQEILMRKDNRLRGHLAAGSRAGSRLSCDGSGQYSARLKLMTGNPDSADTSVMPSLTPAAAFNARAEWAKANALYAEYEDMAETGAADLAAIDSAYEAYSRAWDYARTLSAPGTV